MPARFKLDENLPREAEALLRKAGHDVHTVLDEHLGGNPDPGVFDASRAENRILVTFDLDFSRGSRARPTAATVASLNWPSRYDAKFKHLAKRLKANIHAGSSHVYLLKLPTRLPKDPKLET